MGFALHAGMVPRCGLAPDLATWLLPARRDGSASKQAAENTEKASPCTQGWFGKGLASLVGAEGISLHAGMVRSEDIS